MPGHVTSLRRTRVVLFTTNRHPVDSHDLAQQDLNALEQVLLPVDDALKPFPALNLTEAQAQLIQQAKAPLRVGLGLIVFINRRRNLRLLFGGS